MSRYTALLNTILMLKARAWPRLLQDEKDAIDRAVAVPENEGDKLSREVGEMAEEMLRMNGF